MYTFKLIDLIFVKIMFCFFPGFSSGRGKGRGRSRNEDDQEGAGGRPSGPSTLFDFLESKMGVFSIDGGLYSKL